MIACDASSWLRLTAKRAITALSFSARIRLKWWLDQRKLPLTPNHFELYTIVHRLCTKELGEFPNLINCHDFNDKIQWLKLFDQSAEVVRCNDKLGVREHVRERVGSEYLVHLYQVHDHFVQLDFNALPTALVFLCFNFC